MSFYTYSHVELKSVYLCVNIDRGFSCLSWSDLPSGRRSTIDLRGEDQRLRKVSDRGRVVPLVIRLKLGESRRQKHQISLPEYGTHENNRKIRPVIQRGQLSAITDINVYEKTQRHITK